MVRKKVEESLPFSGTCIAENCPKTTPARLTQNGDCFQDREFSMKGKQLYVETK